LKKIYDVTKGYPREEIYSLIQQTRRSANSVVANIAEAHGRYYYKDKIRVLYIARGEVTEIQSHLRVALGVGYMETMSFNSIDLKYQELYKNLSNYIRYLLTQVNKS